LNNVYRNLAALIAVIARVFPALLRDAAGIIGIGLISYGAWTIYRPAGLIVAGMLLLAGAVLAARAGRA